MTSKTKALVILLGSFALGLVVGALATGVLRSQKERRFERMPPRERFHTFMERVIQPTAAQREEFERIMTRWSERLSELHQEHQNQMFAVYDSLHEELESLLTEEQRNRLEEHLARGSEEVVERRFAGLALALNLDEQQRKQLQKILENMPRPERSAPGSDWEQHRRKMHEQFQETQRQIEEILTPEQRRKFREMKHEFRRPFEDPFPGPPRHRPPRKFQ